MMDNLPPKVQNQIAQFQQLTQQIQMVATQKIQLEAQVKELERTVAELEKTADDSAVFKNVGSLLKHLRERHQNLQQQITQALQGPEPAKASEAPKKGETPELDFE
jgi:chaperonin cofactor prefoldin